MPNKQIWEQLVNRNSYPLFFHAQHVSSKSLAMKIILLEKHEILHLTSKNKELMELTFYYLSSTWLMWGNFSSLWFLDTSKFVSSKNVREIRQKEIFCERQLQKNYKKTWFWIFIFLLSIFSHFYLLLKCVTRIKLRIVI